MIGRFYSCSNEITAIKKWRSYALSCESFTFLQNDKKWLNSHVIGSGQTVVLCLSQHKEWSVLLWLVLKGSKQVTHRVLLACIKFSLSPGLFSPWPLDVPGISRTGRPWGYKREQDFSSALRTKNITLSCSFSFRWRTLAYALPSQK